MSDHNQAQMKLKKAEEAYFLTGKPILTDDEYDILAETAQREGGGSRPVGARPSAKDACLLPVPMPSLRKVKPGMMRDWEGKPAVLSDKLDGISALWCLPEGRLYLRGDQQYGVEKTAFVPYITGLARPPGRWIVRGEIVVAKNNSSDRNIVNGYLHRINPEEDGVPKGVMRFVAYSLYNHDGNIYERTHQFMVLQHAGFEVAWNKYTNVTEKTLMELMQRRRQEGLYGIDGIVVCEPGFPVQISATDQYPSDAVAFKMPLADQMATTKVQEIDWNVGRAGVWTPRLRIIPVVIGGAKIEWVTGHNAGWIRDRSLGVGAEVIIRRSGDVIPIIDSIIKPAPITTWPEGTWDGVHLIYGKAENIMTIVHAIELMGVKQCGKERLNKLNVSTLKELFELPESVWASEIGPGIGPKLRAELHQKAKEIDGIIKVMCYPFLPSAVGRKRIQAWAEHDGSGRPQGWGEDTWKEFSDMLPTINAWIASTFPYKTTTKSVVVKTAAPASANGYVMTMTGFRDEKLKAAAEAKGWTVADLSKKTTHLIIKEGYENKKTEKARADGITIWTVGDAYRILGI